MELKRRQRAAENTTPPEYVPHTLSRTLSKHSSARSRLNQGLFVGSFRCFDCVNTVWSSVSSLLNDALASSRDEISPFPTAQTDCVKTVQVIAELRSHGPATATDARRSNIYRPVLAVLRLTSPRHERSDRNSATHIVLSFARRNCLLRSASSMQ